MPKFTAEEKALLAPYVTDTDGDIFAVTGLQGIAGAVDARYSRAPGGFRETLLKEFIVRKELDAIALSAALSNLLGFLHPSAENGTNDSALDALIARARETVISRCNSKTLDVNRLRVLLAHTLDVISSGQAVNAAKVQDLLDRVLIAYGDDSVAELEGVHMSFENISILATKEIEDRRIGGSPIEQSTRYVFYDKRDDDGNFRYYRDPAVMASPHAAAYVETMDFIFHTYCDLIEPMKSYYMGLKPLEEAEYDVNGDGVKEKWADCADEKLQKAFRLTYNSDIRTKACDTLRALLPIATKTNVGVFGNGRFYQNVLSHCYTSTIPEVRDIATRAQAQLNKVIPKYVKRAAPSAYLRDIHSRMRALAAGVFDQVTPREQEDVALLDRGEDRIAAELQNRKVINADTIAEVMQNEADDLAIACMLFPYVNHSLSHVREVVRSHPRKVALQADFDWRHEVIATYLGDRNTRRDRPGRAFEAGYPYTFDLCTDFGTYKDLERHRMCTQQRQTFTPMVGFNMPEDLVITGHADRALECVKRAQALYELLRTDFPDQASYATLHGSKVRWTLGINDRALMHMIELRTTPQGHPSYRKVCQAMHKLVSRRSWWRGQAIKFADHGDYFWSRGDAEARQRVKEAALERK